MFGIKKKNKKKKIVSPLTSVGEADRGKEVKSVNDEPKLKKEEIRAMPDKFFVTTKGGMKKRTKIIIIAIISILIVGTGAVFFSVDWSKQLADQNNKEANPDIKQADENTNADVYIPSVLNEKEPIEVIKKEDKEEPAIDLNKDKEVIIVLASEDSDKDGLTDVEEILYQTNKNKPDTDSDSYLDGEEVRAGYDPLDPNGRLDASESVKVYDNVLQGYSLLYPSTWRIRTIDTDGQQILLQSDTSQEYIEILTVSDIASLSDWYISSVDQDFNLDTLENINGWSVIRSVDKLTIYFGQTGLESIYIIDYNIAGLDGANYQTTLEMIINSFARVNESL